MSDLLAMHQRALNRLSGSDDEDVYPTTGLMSQASSQQEPSWPKARYGGFVALVLGGMACLLWLGSRAAVATVPAAGKVSRAQAATDSAVGLYEADKVATKMNSMGLSLLSSLHKSQGSVFISPLSIVSALGMVSLGTTPEGAAEKELANAWQVTENEMLDFLTVFRKQLAEVADTSEKVEMRNVNSVWCKSSIKESYIKDAHNKLHAEANPLPSVPGPINAWCSKATNGMVPSIIDQIDPLTVAILVNAVYFKGSWAIKFPHPFRSMFTTAKSGKQPCAMMRREDKHMMYTEHEGAQVVELPYDSADGQLAAVIVLPLEKDGSLAELTSKLGVQGGAASLMESLAGLKASNVELQLPRFSLEFNTDLTAELKSNFGIKQAFDGRGEFMRMSDDPDVHLSAVLHKAKVEVTEDGTKAAAATAAIMMTRAAIVLPPPDKKRVIVNRPFLFFIRHRPTGVLLFSGAVEDPVLDITGV